MDIFLLTVASFFIFSGCATVYAKGLLHPIQQSESLANMPDGELNESDEFDEGLTAEKGEKRTREVNLENISEQSDESTEFNYPAENRSEY